MTSDPAPPDSRWERIAAGVLVLMLAGSLYEKCFYQRLHWGDLRSTVTQMQQGCTALFSLPGDSLRALILDDRIVRGVLSGLWLGQLIGSILILPLAAGRALGQDWLNLRRYFWWIVLAHASLIIVHFAIFWFLGSLGPDDNIDPSAVWPSFQTVWQHWWDLRLIVFHFPESILAVVVLVLTRRKGSLAAGEKG